jgi:hypothetical protein
MSTLKAILDNPRFHDYIPVLKGARNGLVYGAKVRFPHALIMAILFGRGKYVSRTLGVSSWTLFPRPFPSRKAADRIPFLLFRLFLSFFFPITPSTQTRL